MNLNRLFICAAAMAVLFTGCKKESEDTGAASITVNGSKAVELNFGKTASTQEVTIVSNREWALSELSTEAKAWITVSGADGKQEVTSGKTVAISVNTNTGVARSYDLSFTNGTSTATVTVKQSIGDIKTITIADFITKADTVNSYVVKGTITSAVNETYCSFDMKDATGSITVWNVVDSCKTKYAKVLKQGYEVTLSGKYSYYAEQSKHEVTSAVILDYKIPEHKSITVEKVSDAIATAAGDTVIFNNALVVAAAKTGYLVTDSQNTGHILIYQGTASTDTPASVGDKVNVKAVRGDYSSMPQLNALATTIVSSGAQVTWPAPDDITATFDSFESTTVKYVSYKGKLSVSGNYYNITVDGATKIGSILPSAAAEAYKGVSNVIFKGYYLYTASNKYIYTIFTEAQMPSDYLTVSPTTTNVAATAGTTEITVSSDQSWTVASDNAAFTVNPASGSGNGTVTVTYSANTELATRTANITFSVGGTTRATTVITQAAAEDPSATTVELTNAEIIKSLTDLGSSSTTYTEVTYTSASGSWVANSSPSKSNKWIQIRDTKASYLKSPVFASNIEKIEIRTDANKATLARTFYAIPSSTELTSSTKSYADDENKSVLENAYGKVQTNGVIEKGTAGEVGETVTLTFTGDTKDFILLATSEGSSYPTGASYINSIKVYLKNN